MAENAASEEELKLLEIIREKNERIEQLEKDLNAHEIWNESLQNGLNAKEILNKALKMECKTKDSLIKSLKEKLREFEVSADKVEAEQKMDAEKRDENERKIMKGEKDHVKSQDFADSGLDSQAHSAAAKVGTIPLILNKLLKNMITRDLLKNCRLVSKEWRELSTAILLKRTKFQVEFNRLARDVEFKLSSTHTFSRKLEELTAFLPSAKTFPCVHFSFKGNLKTDDAQAFLSQCGSRVKGLKLCGPQNLNCIKNLLVEQIPHLEKLELSGFVDQENSSSVPFIVQAPQILSRLLLFPPDSPAPQQKLCSLTSLKLGEGNLVELVQEILDASPNLQEVFGVRSKQEIENLRSRIHVVKGLKIKRGQLSGLISVGDFQGTMPILEQLHLTSLEVDYSSGKFRPLGEENVPICSIISTILAASQKSLNKVKLTPSPKLDSLIEWPKLEKAGKLKLCGDLTREFPRLFPPLENENETRVGFGFGASTGKIFPNLHTIHLKEIERIGDEQVFERLAQIPTVNTLNISRPQAQTLMLFVPLFPSVKRLVLNKLNNFAYFAPLIWRMEGLKSLEMDFDCAGSEIDAGFTGMEKRTCEFLRISGGSKFGVEQVDGFRESPSILQAKELEQLFLPRGFSVDEELSGTPLNYVQRDFAMATYVSFKYAFNLMPKLRVFPHPNR